MSTSEKTPSKFVAKIRELKSHKVAVAAVTTIVVAGIVVGSKALFEKQIAENQAQEALEAENGTLED